MIKMEERIYSFSPFPRSFKPMLGTLFGVVLWCASTKLCFRTLEFSLAQLVLIFLPDSPQASPSPSCPFSGHQMQSLFFGSFFYFVSFLPFSGQKTVFFSLHCLGTSFFFQSQCWIILTYHEKFRKHWTSTVHLAVLVSVVSCLNGVFIYGRKKRGCYEFSDLKCCSFPSGMSCWLPPNPTLSTWLCSALSLVGEIWSILSISADIETVGEILLKIIPTLEEVRACWTWRNVTKKSENLKPIHKFSVTLRVRATHYLK